MHSTLQAELRFTRILSATCRHCARRQSSKPRAFHSTPRPRLAQDPPATPGSPNDRLTASHAKGAEPRPEPVNERTKSETQPLDRQPQSTTKEALPESADSREDSHYGSAAKRRLRNRVLTRGHQTENEAPAWFTDNNIQIFGEYPLISSPNSHVGLVPDDKVVDTPVEYGSSETPSPNFENLSRETLWRDYVHRADGAYTGGEQVDIRPEPETPNDIAFYHLVYSQYAELVRIANGLMRNARHASQSRADPDLRSHLLLSYAGSNASKLLDKVVEDVARSLYCNVITIDANDIAELITSSDQPSSVTMAGRMLSYQVFSEVYSETSPLSPRRPLEEDEDEEEEEDDDDHIPDLGSAIGRSMPFLTGKPIAIPLKDLFGSLPSTSASSTSGGRTRFSDVFSMQPSKSKARPDLSNVTDAIFKSFIRKQKHHATLRESMLNALDNGRPVQEDTNEQTPSVESSPMSAEPAKVDLSKTQTIVHIKDYRTLQDNPIGQDFLIALHSGISALRRSGNTIMMLGSDSARQESTPMTRQKIREIQDGRIEEVSQNIVLTPVLHTTLSQKVLDNDRRQHITAINMRHLVDLLRSRRASIYPSLQPGFWRRDFTWDWPLLERFELDRYVWSYPYASRLATYLIGSADKKSADGEAADSSTDPKRPSILAAATELRKSDDSKIQWANTSKPNLKDKAADESGHEQSGPKLMKLFGNQGGQDVEEGPISSFDGARLRRIRATATKYEKKLMTGIIEPRNIKTTFNDVHMPAETIDALQVLTTLSLTRPDAFKYGVLASDKIPGLLLYGPPGTGKTLAAKAVAKESGATMLEVSAADINDMYVGEGEKNVKALFSLAKKLSPCVVFLDEADAIFSARSNQGRRVNHRELLNQFLKEWDGMSNDSGSAFIMVATNRPLDLDDAVLRRLPRRLLVDLPTESDRLEILRIHLRNEHLAQDVDLANIAKTTPFYSGSDLKNLSVAAALNAVKEENELAKTHTGADPYQHPERRTLTEKHFAKAMDEISASISEDMSSLRDIKKFDEQYGDKRGKKKRPRLGFPTKGKEVKDTIKVREA